MNYQNLLSQLNTATQQTAAQMPTLSQWLQQGMVGALGQNNTNGMTSFGQQGAQQAQQIGNAAQSQSMAHGIGNKLGSILGAVTGEQMAPNGYVDAAYGVGNVLGAATGGAQPVQGASGSQGGTGGAIGSLLAMLLL